MRRALLDPMSQLYFDDVAPEWEKMRAAFFPDAVREKAVAAASLPPRAAVLDVGAGSGFVSAALVAAGHEVVAVDASPAMVEELRRRFGGRVAAREADAQALPFPDASFDGVFANMCLHHVEDPALAVREMARVLRPGGRLVVTDLDEHEHEFLRTEHHDRWMGFARPTVAAWLRDAGLEDVAVVDAGERCSADSSCGSDKASISIFLASGRRAGDGAGHFNRFAASLDNLAPPRR